MFGYSSLPNDQNDNITNLIELFDQLDASRLSSHKHFPDNQDTSQVTNNISILKQIAFAIALEDDFCPPSNPERFDGFINALRKSELENKKKIEGMENKKDEIRKDIDAAASPYIEFINLRLKRNSNAIKLKEYELDKRDFSFMRLFYRKLGRFFFLTLHLSETYALLLAPRSNIIRNIGTFVGFFLSALVNVVIFPFTVIKSIVDYKNNIRKCDEKIKLLTETLNNDNKAIHDKLFSLAEINSAFYYVIGKLYEAQGMNLKAAESYVQIGPDHAPDYDDYIEVMLASAEKMYCAKNYELAKGCLQKALLVNAETTKDKENQDRCQRLMNFVVSALENKKLNWSEMGWKLSDEARDPSNAHLQWMANLQRRIYDDSLNKTGFFGRETIGLTVKNEQGVKMPKQEVNVHVGIKMILDEMEKFRRGQSTTADACQNIQAIARKQLKDNPSSFFNTVHTSEVDLYKSIVSSTVMARC